MTKIRIEFLLANCKEELDTVISVEDIHEVANEFAQFKKYLDFPYLRCLLSLERSYDDEVIEILQSKDYNVYEYKKTVEYQIRRILYLMEFSQGNIEQIMELIRE